MRKVIGLLIAYIGLSINVEAQEDIIKARLSGLNFSDQLPEEILSSKTVVLIDVPYNGTHPKIRSDWSEMASIAQKGFARAGIDAVAYYHIDDILSGPEAYHEYLNAFDDRNLSHAAILKNAEQGYELTLLKMQDRQYLIKEGQEAFHTASEDLPRMFEMLYRNAANSGLTRTNLLIIETPELGGYVDVITSKRSEFYDLNFKGDDLAIPIFADTAEINKVMAEYPFKWAFADDTKDDKTLRSEGFEYILSYVTSTAEKARKILEYPVNDSETAFISEIIVGGKSQVVSQPSDAVVYKFYIRQLSNSNRYVGKRWDAGYTWQEGLSNYIANLRNELVRN